MSILLGFSDRDLASLAGKLGALSSPAISLPRHLRPVVVQALHELDHQPIIWLAEDRRELVAAERLGIAAWPSDDQALHAHSVSEAGLARARLLAELASGSLPILATLSETGEGVITPSGREQLRIPLRVGERLSQRGLIERLEQAGYHRGLSDPGTYETKGDTMTLRDLSDRPVRIELFGDSVERLSDGKDRPRTLTIEPLVSAGRGSLSAYAPRIVSSQPDSSAAASLLFTPDGVDLGLRALPFFYRQPERLRVYLRTLISQGYRITAEGSDELLRGICRELEIPTTDHPAPSPGWIWSIERRAHLTDADFRLPARQTHAQFRIEKLTAGEPLVHRDYGIARFGGALTRELDGIQRSYLRLDFAGADRLYLPIEQFDRLSPYLGAHEPTLSRLGGTGWAELLARVQTASHDIALELLNRYARRTLAVGTRFARHPIEEEKFNQAFGYPLTPGQERVIAEVLENMTTPEPMDRLVTGDVGYGKTEVAWRAAFRAVFAGKQVALIAPTTILVEQHLQTGRRRFTDWPVRLEALSRFRSPREQRQILSDLAADRVDIIIGTHRLLSRDVLFADLGLVIIDEEQRFGVEAKERLRRLHEQTDVLTLSATPIPRTLELALGEIRPLSHIETSPEGRRRVETLLIEDSPETIETALAHELSRGGQAYVITPRIRSVPKRLAELQALFPKARIGVGHGQLPEAELAQVMGTFAAGGLDILLASSIIENGLDLPEANTILIDDPSRFGLAELHQLRGRVGRSEVQGYCYLLLGPTETGATQSRLEALTHAADSGGGLEIALRDLELRGGGDILGRAQHGHIMDVGLPLYTQLLDEARLEIEAGRPLQLTEAVIDLPVETALPETFNQIDERITIYRQIENVEDEPELENVAISLSEQYGSSEPIGNLVAIKRLKLRSQGTPVTGVRQIRRPAPRGGSRPYLVISLGHEPTEAELAALPGWRAKGRELQRPADLDEDPIETALAATERLAELALGNEPT